MKRMALLIALLLALGAAVCGALAKEYVIPADTLVIEAEVFAGSGFSESYAVRLPEGIPDPFRIGLKKYPNNGYSNKGAALRFVSPISPFT